jgi:predicted nucleic acid-binding protein
MRIALDTNILVYAEGLGEKEKHSTAINLLERIENEYLLLPVQTLGELYRVLTAKAGKTAVEARESILGWVDSYEVADSTWTAFQSAFDLSAAHQFQIWDALIISVSAEAHCRILLSEDLQDGYVWSGLTIINPFQEPPHSLLKRVIDAE